MSMARQRVTLIAPHDTGQPTGILTYVNELVRRQPDDLDLRVRHLGKREWVVRGKRIGGTLSTWASLARLKLGPEDGLVHATDTFCLAKGTHVLTIHDLIPATVSRHLGARVHQARFRKRIGQVPRIVTPTRVVADQVRTTFGLPPERVSVIPMGVDLERFRPVSGIPRGVAPGKANLLYVGAYRPYKHIDRVLEALAGTDIRFVRVGPPGKDAYYQTCVQAAARGNVDFVDVGYVAADDLPAYYSACDLLVYPSRDEGFGIPPLEAMACGTPSVVSDIPVFREVYGNAAHYVHDFTAASLKATIEDALARPLAPSALQAHARQYSWDATARGTYAVYRDVLAGLAPPRLK